MMSLSWFCFTVQSARSTFPADTQDRLTWIEYLDSPDLGKVPNNAEDIMQGVRQGSLALYIMFG